MSSLSIFTASCFAFLCLLSWSDRSAFAENVLQGSICSARVHELTSQIEWSRSLAACEESAQAEGKLILWVHMLGKIDGAT